MKSGSAPDQMQNHAYGPFREATRASETISQPSRFGGYLFDGVTGLYGAGSRICDPTAARFLTKDEADPDLRNLSSLNPNTSGANAPASFVDSTGQSPIKPRSAGPRHPSVGPSSKPPKPMAGSRSPGADDPRIDETTSFRRDLGDTEGWIGVAATALTIASMGVKVFAGADPVPRPKPADQLGQVASEINTYE